jgi:hypothetical protein
MKTIFIIDMNRRLMLTIFALSAGLSNVTAASLNPISGAPKSHTASVKTASTTSGCSGPGCYAIGAKSVSLVSECGSPGCLAAGAQARWEPMNINPNEIASMNNLSADEWGYWVYVSNGVSVRFKIVQRNYENGNPLWTWQFKNDLGSKITYLKFEYTEYKGYSAEKHTDYFPGSLRGGETFGGWSAFTATSTIQPSIRIVEIERE